MELEHFYRRVTHRYAAGWSHLDDYEPVVSLRITPFQLRRPGNGYDDEGTWTAYTRLPAGSNWREIARAIENTMAGSRCRHEYDCCGCYNRRVFTRLVAPRRLQIRVDVTRNY